MQSREPQMTADDVFDIVTLLQENGGVIIVEGWWAVDALLGEQTRDHEDKDVAVYHRDFPKKRALPEIGDFVKSHAINPGSATLYLETRRGTWLTFTPLPSIRNGTWYLEQHIRLILCAG